MINEDAERMIRIVREADKIAYDTETSGVDWRYNFPIGYIVATENESLYVPVRHGGGGNLPGVPVPKTATDPIEIHPFEKDLARAFQIRSQSPNCLTIGHHIKFDCHMSANAGIYLGRNISCTQNYETLLNEYSRSYSLESCARSHGVQAKKGESMYQHLADVFGIPADRKAMSRFWELPGDDDFVGEYARGDGTTTYQLWHAQKKKIAEQEIEGIASLESRLIWTLFRMERRGIKVDTQYVDQLKVLIEKKLKVAMDKLPAGFNVRSPIDVKNYVTEAGHTNWPTTEHGNPSFTERWLRSFPEGNDIVTIRKMSNLINSFVNPLITDHTFNGRVHATFNQLKADDYGTPARLSCSAPNLQQIPKRDKELALLFRKAFVADPGFDFNEADWSQCEPRLYAHYSKEPALIEGYLRVPFEDVHGVVARQLNVERDPTAKRMNMGIFTGMYPKTFAEHMGWPLDKATLEWNRWHSMFPHIRVFQDTAKRALLDRGYVKTILGRKLHLDHSRFAYRAVSKIIQGGNADIMKFFMLEIDQMLERGEDKVAHILASVHDSLEWQTAKTKEGKQVKEEILRMMVRVMDPPFNLRVPFEVEHNSGANWSEATFGKAVDAKAPSDTAKSGKIRRAPSKARA